MMESNIVGHIPWIKRTKEIQSCFESIASLSSFHCFFSPQCSLLARPLLNPDPAKVGGNGSTLAFGGWDTSSVTSVRVQAGYYAVTFNGIYTLNFGIDSVIVNSTAESTQWGVSNAYVISANANQIVVGVYTWQSYTFEDLRDNNFFVTIHTT